VPVTVILPDADKHYVNIQTTLIADSQSQSRAFALALYPATGKSLKKAAASNAARQDSAVIMEAEEHIKSGKPDKSTR